MSGLLKKLVLGANVDNKIVKIPYLVLAVSIISTLGVSLIFYKSSMNGNAARFNNSVDGVQSLIESKINLYIALLKGTRAFVTSTENLDREKFAAYVKGLELEKNYAGIDGIGFVKTVFPDEQQAAAIGKREIRQNIVFLEPWNEKTKGAIGFDLNTEENRRQAMVYAAEIAAATLAPKIPSNADNAENPRNDFSIFLPLYADGKIPATVQERNQNLRGYIFSQTDAAFFLDAVHKETWFADVALRIYDGEPKPENLLAQSGFAQSGSFVNPSSQSFYSKKTLELAGRKWTIEYIPRTESLGQGTLKWVSAIFGAGIIFSFILFGLSYTEASMRGKIQRLAADLFDLEQQKHELFEKEQQARQAAERANTTKDEFIAIVSHELRTPLNAIAGWTKILDTEELPADKKRLALTKIDKNLRRQTRLVEELLDFSQILAGKKNLELISFDFTGVFENAFSEMEPLAHSREIILTKINNLNGQQIEGDRAKIETVIRNLLSNAIKFTPAGGKIEAEVSPSAGNVELIIKDTGSGISSEFLPFIFDRFRQDDASSTRFHGGFGLGLAISERIVKLHHGSIEAYSEGKGKGAVFIVKLPFKSG